MDRVQLQILIVYQIKVVENTIYKCVELKKGTLKQVVDQISYPLFFKLYEYLHIGY